MKTTLFILFLFYVTSFSQESEQYIYPGEKHFKNVKMLTDGGENAEAYLSFSEQQLILQITNGDVKCDQIFTMGTDGSNLKMVSNGKGRTTCAYFLPDDAEIIYASTHLADADCPPPPDRSRGYVWKLYDSFDLFISNVDGTNIRRVTDAPGYDAEATVSPLGDKIVFTSLRDGDPELYLMDIDGTNQKRLTFEKGYDGGAFFSPDGKQLIFRASRPKTEKELKDYDELVKEGLVRPTAFELFMINVDGTGLRQITNLGKASFAPYMHPDGKRIIFSSNINSETGRDFDLYMINTDGTNLEQITFNKTFDGFPMFTRDGKKLVFASNRFSKKEGDTNIFICDWID
ncbi:MAG: PD40 domain-containing protein [Ignavibacteriaceae bacterium]|nr:PD40 domain-containing protein [Ignavibacteriaceae bacterium]